MCYPSPPAVSSKKEVGSRLQNCDPSTPIAKIQSNVKKKEKKKRTRRAQMRLLQMKAYNIKNIS